MCIRGTYLQLHSDCARYSNYRTASRDDDAAAEVKSVECRENGRIIRRCEREQKKRLPGCVSGSNSVPNAR